MVRIQLFSCIKQPHLLKSPRVTKKILNSKRARKLNQLLTLDQSQLKHLSSKALLSHTPHILHKFAHLLTLSSLHKKSNYRIGQKSRPFTLVGVPKFYRDSVFLQPTYSSSGTLLHRREISRSNFFRKRAFDVSSANLSRVLGSYNRITRYETSSDVAISGVPKSVRNILQEDRRAKMALSLQSFLILRRRLSTRCRLRFTKFATSSPYSPYKPSRAPRPSVAGSQFFMRYHVQDYIADAYSDLPKTISRTLRDFTATLFPSFYTSCKTVLRQNSALFIT